MSPPEASKMKQKGEKRSRRRWVLYVYLVLLGTSHVVRFFSPTYESRADQQTLSLAEVDGDRPGSGSVHLSYVDSNPDAGKEVPVVIVLHGSPASSSFMMGMHRALANSDSLRIITPDLPGFGGSTRTISDYSNLSHAVYLLQLMDSLEIDRAHLVGYSMSGGVVLHAYNMAPERVASITMLSAIGVQELELMGDYLMNHSVHALQLAGLWLIQEGVPHFGWMDDALLSVPYARNFFDTDQRPLRAILESYRGPMTIIHGSEDPLVPIHAAREHHRIVPQSDLHLIAGGGHEIPFSSPDAVAALVMEFVQRVESGAAPTFEDAMPDRLRSMEAPFDFSSLPPAKDFALVVLIILIAGATLVSEDLASIGAGLMAARGTMTLGVAFGAAFGGIVLGDVLLYGLGRWLGHRVVRMIPFKWFIREDSLNQGSAWFERRGIRVIVASRFIPGSRLPTYVAAGMLKVPFWKFLFYFLLASLAWTPVIVGLSTVMGNRFLTFYDSYESLAIWVLIGLVVVLFSIFHFLLPAFSHRGRRRLVSRWHRLTRWEFWSPLIFYPPVVIYVAWLALKHRSLTVFTAANPGIPHGGFVGESKAEILSSIAGTGSLVAGFAAIEPDSDGPEKVAEFMESRDLSFPVVLKPDTGERGTGVTIAHSDADVASYFAATSARCIVQEFAPGREYGIFYIRYPGDSAGRIISITDKRLIEVTGDGSRRLEDLILDDDRAVSMAPMHLSRHAEHLDSIPEKGQKVELVDIGTHSRGALFLDGSDIWTPELAATFDRISKTIDGFYFGRYDVRTADIEGFRKGQDFKIIELNGVTSEATHIYDPGNSLWSAYRTLFDQWRIAFEIGGENRSLGANPESVVNLVRLIIRFKLS